jgi:hypothetical protein
MAIDSIDIGHVKRIKWSSGKWADGRNPIHGRHPAR